MSKTYLIKYLIYALGDLYTPAASSKFLCVKRRVLTGVFFVEWEANKDD